MGTDLLVVAAVALLCGAWAVIQRFVAVRDPEQPGVEGTRCGSCRGDCGNRCHE